MLCGIPAPVREMMLLKLSKLSKVIIVCATDGGHIVALTLLDLSSAFDIVDHTLLLSILQNRFPVTGLSQEWFHFYLTNRT